jgi:hypothetical protein
MYEIIGQSNALGNPEIALVPLPSYLVGPLHNIHSFEPNAAEWQILELGVNNSGDQPLVTGRYGAEGWLGLFLRDYYNEDIYFLKTAKGGAGLTAGSEAPGSLNWMPATDNHMYERAATNRALAYAGLNPNVQMKARIWIQGEQSANSTYSSSYQADTITFVNALGTDVPFIDFSLSSQQTALNSTHRGIVNTAKQNTSSIIYDSATGIFTTQSGGVTIRNKVYVIQNEPTSEGLHYGAVGLENLAAHAFEVIKYLNNR